MNGAYLASLVGESASEVRNLRNDLPRWMVLVGIAGRELLPEQRVAAHEQSIGEIAKQFGLRMQSSLPGAQSEATLAKLIMPSGPRYWKDTLKGAFQDLFFVTTLDLTPTYVRAMQTLAADHGYPSDEIGVYIQPQNCGVSCHLEFTLPYDDRDAAETRRMKRLFTKASEDFSSRGAYFTRPYGAWSSLQLNKDAQSYAALRTLKSIFDPNMIMNPGKLIIQ